MAIVASSQSGVTTKNLELNYNSISLHELWAQKQDNWLQSVGLWYNSWLLLKWVLSTLNRNATTGQTVHPCHLRATHVNSHVHYTKALRPMLLLYVILSRFLYWGTYNQVILLNLYIKILSCRWLNRMFVILILCEYITMMCFTANYYFTICSKFWNISLHGESTESHLVTFAQ